MPSFRTIPQILNGYFAGNKWICKPLKTLGVKVPGSRMPWRRIVGIMALIQVFIYVIMSYMLFNPSVFGRFFPEDGTMNLITGISMVTGVVANVFL